MNHSAWQLAHLALVLVAVTVATASCGSPLAEREAAETSVKLALETGAETYAPDDLDAATYALESAERLVRTRQYREAKTIYLLARILAEAAAKTAETRKAALRTQLERGLADSEFRWHEVERQARVRIAEWPAGGAARREWNADVKRAKAALESAKALVHDDPPGANANFTTLSVVLTKWERELHLRPTSQRDRP